MTERPPAAAVAALAAGLVLGLLAGVLAGLLRSPRRPAGGLPALDAGAGARP